MLEETVGTLEKIDASLKDSAELFALAKGEGDDAMLASIERRRNRVSRSWSPTSSSGACSTTRWNPNNCFVDINAGQGGTEAQDWTSMLLRMYSSIATGRASTPEVSRRARARSPA